MNEEREIPLDGGDITEGVVRVGDTVRRPVGAHSRLVHDVLEHLRAVGFEGAPRFLGIDEHGREILTFVEGEVAGRPWPSWVADEGRITSVARLVRRLDDAMIDFGLPDGAPTTDGTADPPGCPPGLPITRPFLGHRDITPENVVFRQSEAYALIDFDLIRPSSRLDEVLSLLTYWAPLADPTDREPALADVDAFARTRLLVDAYGLASTDGLVPHAIRQAERTWFAMRRRAEELGGGWQRMWDDGVGDQIRRRVGWLQQNAERLEGALAHRNRMIS